jgi:UDP-glucuronate decarboxylase
MTELVNVFNEATGLSCTIEYNDYPSSYPGDEPLRRCPSIQKAQQHLSYKPKISLSDGLRYTYDWALLNYK